MRGIELEANDHGVSVMVMVKENIGFGVTVTELFVCVRSFVSFPRAVFVCSIRVLRDIKSVTRMLWYKSGSVC
jgi:hypothetical protein